MAMISVYRQNLSLFLTDLAYFRQNSSNKCKNSSQSQKTQGFYKKTQCTGGFSLFDPPKKFDKKPV